MPRMKFYDLTVKKPIASRFLTGLTLLIAAVSPLFAEQAIDLSEAIDRTLQQHPEMAVWTYRQQDQQARSDIAGLRQSPELDLSVEDAFGTDEYSGIDAMQTTLSVRWQLEGDQMRARSLRADAQQRLLNAQQGQQVAELKAETASLFIAMLADQQRLKLAQESLEDEQKLLDIVQRRADAGRAPITDLMLVQTRLAERALAVEEYEHRLISLSLRLSAQWGQSDPTLRSAGDLQQTRTVPETDDILASLTDTPAVTVALAEQQLFSADGQLAGAEAKTPWTVGAGVRRHEATGDYALIGQVSIPLGNQNRTSAYQRSASAREQQQALSARAVLRALEVEARTLLIELEHSQHVIDTLTGTILPALDTGRQQALQAYERGQLDYLQWDNARQQWLSARERLLDEAEALQPQWIELQRLTGQATYF